MSCNFIGHRIEKKNAHTAFSRPFHKIYYLIYHITKTDLGDFSHLV